MKKILKYIVLILLFCVLNKQIKAQAIANFGFDKNPAVYCLGDTVNFQNTSVGHVYQKWIFSDSYETYAENPKHIYEQAGTFKVTLFVYDNTGNVDSISYDVVIKPNPILILSINGEQNINYGESVTLSISGSYNSIFWSDDFLGESRIITTAGIYKITAINEAGCLVSDFLVLNVKTESGQAVANYEITVVNTILTPNNDGFNDFLLIENLADYKFPCTIKIFNTAGSIVYSSENYQNNWNGSYNNIKLPSGTYFFITWSEGRKGGTGFIDIL